MAFIHGRKTRVYINQYNLSSWFNNATRQTSIEANETTMFLKDNKTYAAGLADGTLSLSGLFDGSALATDAVLSAIIQSLVNPVITVVHGATLAVGLPTSGGAGVITGYSVTAPVGDMVSASMDFQGSDGIRSGRLIGYGQSVTVDGSGTSVDNGAATSNGGFAVLHVISNTIATSTSFIVEHSTNNSSWATLGTFTLLGASAIGSEEILFPMGTTVNQYVRLTYDVTGAGTVVPICTIVRL